ncbi:MAG: acetyl-CoA carboxylase biotin carboxylase subunit [Calditrichaeota bacterium]|nr:acetyl-CoA carboxylase biotin carboxylase subunit [Calditrichota bacterium]MCB9366470.1 acetyl-CoA carboxylase biotin carboxylase subunit [Calditrichota bacterium]MCB9391272.1 acetyl-CoA carboxylase biotin carboxylase subunit [Calditrichota bacterium]
MFKKVLVANRGEIALRVMRACKDIGLSTVAVFSTADRDSLHVRFADESVCIGPPQATESYLSPRAIMSAAEIAGADAIHPGYGFLAENEDFAQICQAHEVVWIGPDPKVIQMMGNKSEAKRTMIKAGCPVVPGSDGPVESAEEARTLAEEFGLPVMIKAVAGGGGRGMRLVTDIANVETAFEMASAEAEAAFSNGDLYLEKAIVEPRHVEIQVMGDGKGNCIHFGERDCSMQRRHQKLIEESPSPAVSPELREKMGRTATQAAAAINYSGAGTMEFLLDRSGHFYFMEMNTRIQVEHPVTEMVTGADLVKWQLLVALGHKLPRQKDVQLRGHAIECRVNAEDAARGFLPSPGKVATWNLPGGPGVRVDTHVYQGYSIPPFYDSLIAKLIVWGETREEAIVRCKRALSEFIVEGIQTTIPFHLQMLETEAFLTGDIHTKWVEQYMEQQSKS